MKQLFKRFSLGASLSPSWTTAAASRTYTDAIEKLNTLQSNAATLEAMRKSGQGPKAELAIAEMIEYLNRIGYSPDDLNALDVLHVTGTKGKGSTCAFVDSLLRHAAPCWKVGLYTSPHLVAARERIRINGDPISEELFARYFFYVWDKLEKSTSSSLIPPGTKPMYFKFLTLVAFHAFMAEKVDATVLEVGVGGMYDSTNIVPKPIVTGVTSLGLDHIHVLGKTLAEIGWQKGGIYKPGVPAFTVEQLPEGLASLEQQAKDRGAPSFTVVTPIPELSTYKLGLRGAHQIHNATLAVHLAHQFILNKLPRAALGTSTSPTPLSASFIAGLENARWPGRCQQVIDPERDGTRADAGKTTWFLDGAHTVESLKACAEWFASPGVALPAVQAGDISDPPLKRGLIFNCTSGRSGLSFITALLQNITVQLEVHQQASILKVHPGFFDVVIFCTNVTHADGHFKGGTSKYLTQVAMHDSERLKLEPQRQLAEAWSSVVPEFPSGNIHVLPSIEHAVGIIRDFETGGSDVQVLVAGSLHLVGGVIEVAGLGNVALSSGAQ